jgi:hypothetical protein
MARRFDVLETLVEQARDPARGWHRVPWAVDGRERCKSFATKAPRTSPTPGATARPARRK